MLIVAAAGVGAVMLALFPVSADVPPTAMPAMALILFSVVMWATGALPEYVAALIFFAVATVSAIATPATIFSGFQSNAWWLVFGGLVIGAAADSTGLGLWVARRTMRHVTDSYASLIFAILAGSLVLSFIVPSTFGRLAIVVPAVVAIAREIGHPMGTRGSMGAVVAAVFGNYTLGHGMLPANLTNILLTGTGETLYGIHVTYGEYLMLTLPFVAVARGLIGGLLIVWFFKPAHPGRPVSRDADQPLSDSGRKLLVTILFALAAWSTDFLHGVSSGWIALIAAVICLVPEIGIMPARLFVEKVSMVTLLFVAAVLGIGPVLSESGAGALLANLLVDWVQPQGKSPAYGYFVMAYMASLGALVSNVSGSIATVSQIAAEISAATGLPLKTAVLAQIDGLNSIFFPYEALPVLVGLTMGGVPVIKTLKFSISFATLGLVVVVPLNFVYWRLLGYIPG